VKNVLFAKLQYGEAVFWICL